MPFDFEGEANTGDSTQLSCYVSKGDTPINITWTLNGKDFAMNSGVTTTLIGSRTNLLTINSLQPQHSGTYTCTASNKGGSAEHSAELLINGTLSLLFAFFCSCPFCFISFLLSLVPPQIVHFDFGDEPVNSGEMVSILCTVNKGDYPIDISWFLNNVSASDIHGISVLRTNKRIVQLSIDSVQAEHAGEFACVAKNPAGTATYSAVLHVNGIYKSFFVLPYSTSSNNPL